jgi:hypothetical protein
MGNEIIQDSSRKETTTQKTANPVSEDAGTMIEPELFWVESGYSHNLLIKDNTFRNTGWLDAALSINGPAIGHADIILEHNTFENNAAVNAYLAGIHNLTIKDNLVCSADRSGDDIQFAGCKLFDSAN